MENMVISTHVFCHSFSSFWQLDCVVFHISNNNHLIYSRVLESAQFCLFIWLFWHTPHTLNFTKSSPLLDSME